MPLLTLHSDRTAGEDYGGYDLTPYSDAPEGVVSDYIKPLAVDSYARKSGGGSLLTLSVIGATSFLSYTDDPRTYTWPGGSGNVGLYCGNGVATGYRLSCPVGTEPIEIPLWVALWATTMRVEVSLSDSSATPVVSTVLADTSSTGMNGFYRVAAAAGSPGQTLYIDVTIDAVHTAGGNVCFNAACVRRASIGLDLYKAALAAVQSGTADARVIVVGDSNAVAYQSSGTMAGNAIARSWPAKLAGSMVNNPGVFSGFLGDSLATNSGSTPAAFDFRVSMGTGWTVNSLETIGGRMFVGGSTSGGYFGFTPGVAFTKVRIGYSRYSGSPQYAVNIDGGSSLGTLAMNGTGLAFEEFTASGSDTSQIRVVSNGTAGGRLVSIEAWDASGTQVRIMTCGIPGATAASWAVATNDYSPLNAIRAVRADLVEVNLGINDLTYSTRQEFRNSLRKLLWAAKGFGSVLLHGFQYMGEWGPATFAIQDQWRGDAEAVAAECGVEYNDITDWAAWATYAAAVGNSFMDLTDQVHITDAGHTSLGSLNAPLIDFAPPVPMQHAYPDADISAGAWTPSSGSDLYAMLDEETPSDADYISTTSNSTAELGLGSMPTPGDGAQTLRYRAAGSPLKALKVGIYTGATLVEEWTTDPLSSAVTEYLRTLATPITDTSDLRVKVQALDAASPPGLTASYGSPNGAFAYDDSTSPLSVAHKATVADREKCLLFIGQKPSTANSGSITTPGGFSLLGSLTGAGGYGATLGADTGNTNIYVYERDCDGTEGGTSISLAHGTTNVLWTRMVYATSSTGFWASSTAATGSDTTAGSVSITAASDPGFQSGDLAIWAMCIPTDVTTPSQFSAHAITATGATFGSATEIGEADSTTGNDIGGYLAYASVTSGTSSAAPTFTATAGGTTTNVRGPGIVVRLRAAAPAEVARVTSVRFSAPEGDGSTDGAADGDLLATAASILPGSASGQRNGTAVDATISTAASLISGTATAATNATADGVLLQAGAGLVSGGANGAVNASAGGQTLGAASSVIGGAASGQVNVTAESAVIVVAASLIPGSASSGSSGNADGVLFAVVAEILAGGTAATRSPTANGDMLSAAASLIPGAASAGTASSAAGVTITAQVGIQGGSATGVRNVTATGTTITTASSLTSGTGSAQRSPTAAGVTMSATSILQTGAASASTNGTATGKTLASVGAILAGAASGTLTGAAPGALLDAALAQILPGVAQAQRSAQAFGAFMDAITTFTPGGANVLSSDPSIYVAHLPAVPRLARLPAQPHVARLPAEDVTTSL